MVLDRDIVQALTGFGSFGCCFKAKKCVSFLLLDIYQIIIRLKNRDLLNIIIIEFSSAKSLHEVS